MKYIVSATCAGIAATLGLTCTAQAQNEYFSRDKYTAVNDRRQPDFDPQAVRVGSFSVLPYAEAGVQYETNVFATEEDDEADTVVTLGVGGVANSDWRRHRLTFFGNSSYNEYLDLADNSALSTTVGSRARLDVQRGFTISPNISYSDVAEDRGDFAGGQDLAEPVRSTRLQGGVTAAYETGRLRLSAGVSSGKADYDDVALLDTTGELDQDFRDNTTTSAQVRATYAVNPNFAVFAQGSASETEYDETVLIDSIERSRDRENVSIRAGADFELAALVRGDVGVGYFENDVQDEFFNDSDGLSVDASLTWFPTEITNITFDARRGVVDFGLVNAASAVQTSYGARIVHELRRNVVLGAGITRNEEEYDDVDRTDEQTTLSANATYKLNPNVHFRGYVRAISRDASGPDANLGRSFDNQIVGVSIRLFP